MHDILVCFAITSHVFYYYMSRLYTNSLVLNGFGLAATIFIDHVSVVSWSEGVYVATTVCVHL